MGQNFLRWGRDARRIVKASGVGARDIVVEFGAGGGMLTRHLAPATGRLVAVECDPYWASRLAERFAGDAGVTVVAGDAASVGLPDEPFVVVANVPFNATTRIMHRLLDDPGLPLRSAHLLVQREVARKHAHPVPTTLKTLTWSPWYRFSAGLGLPADAVHPEPAVEACLLAVTRRVPPLVDPGRRDHFRALVRLAFEGRGVGVGRVLRPVFTRAQLRRVARENGFWLDQAPSTLSVYQWAAVFRTMSQVVPPERWPRAARREGGRGA